MPVIAPLDLSEAELLEFEERQALIQYFPTPPPYSETRDLQRWLDRETRLISERFYQALMLFELLNAGVAASVKERGEYVSGQEYAASDVVQVGAWKFIAKTLTTDDPTPTLTGGLAWVLPDAPTWSLQTGGAVPTGQEFTFEADGIVDRVRVWTPNTTQNYQVLITIGGTQTPLAIGAYADDGWVDVPLNPRIVRTGDVIKVELLADGGEFVAIADYWLSNDVTWLDAAGVPTPANAHGADIRFQQATISPDWDLY